MPAAEAVAEPPSGLLSKLRLQGEDGETRQEQEQTANEPADIFEAGKCVC